MLSVPVNVRSLIISNILIRIDYFLNEWIDNKCGYIYVRIKIVVEFWIKQMAAEFLKDQHCDNNSDQKNRYKPDC